MRTFEYSQRVRPFKRAEFHLFETFGQLPRIKQINYS